MRTQVEKLGELSDADRLSVAASAQEAIVDAIANKLRRAQEKYPESKMVVTGGVACNSRLRQKIPEAYFPEPKHCTDNAAMVALLAAHLEKKEILQEAPLNVGAFAHGKF